MGEQGRRLEDTKMRRKGDSWNWWGKRLGVIVATITLLTALGSTGRWVYHNISRKPRLVVREQNLRSLKNGTAQFNLTFTVVNGAPCPIYVNELYLVEGPFTVGTGIGMSMKVPEFSDRVHISMLADPRGRWHQLVPPVSTSEGRAKSTERYAAHRIFMGPRRRMEPTEQLDYHLHVDVTWPKRINLMKLRDPQLQAYLLVKCENDRGDPSELWACCNLLFW